jgi:hypothetical protein
LLSLVSQTPLVQVSVAAAAVQVPSSVGFAWAPSLGTGVPLATVGRHMCIVSLHQVPAAQSASTLQPPEGSHVPLTLHIPERQTLLVAGVQGPSPFA